VVRMESLARSMGGLLLGGRRQAYGTWTLSRSGPTLVRVMKGELSIWSMCTIKWVVCVSEVSQQWQKSRGSNNQCGSGHRGSALRCPAVWVLTNRALGCFASQQSKDRLRVSFFSSHIYHVHCLYTNNKYTVTILPPT
jgi:hypothetical protein